jgi:hypothetical protein
MHRQRIMFTRGTLYLPEVPFTQWNGKLFWKFLMHSSSLPSRAPLARSLTSVIGHSHNLVWHSILRHLKSVNFMLANETASMKHYLLDLAFHALLQPCYPDFSPSSIVQALSLGSPLPSLASNSGTLTLSSHLSRISSS